MALKHKPLNSVLVKPSGPDCNLGCTKDRIKDPNDQRQPRFCLAYQMFFEHADAKMRQLAERWAKKQQDQEEYQRTGGYYQAFKDLKKE